MNPKPDKRGAARRAAIIAFIECYTAEHGFAPSIREIGCAVGLSSSSTVFAHLRRLEAEGWLERNKAIPRSVRLTAVPRSWLRKLGYMTVQAASA